MANTAQCNANDGRDVLYRNMRTTATILLKPGERIPPGDTWMPLAEDNTPITVRLYFGKGPVWESSGRELEGDEQVNILMDRGFVEGDFRSGLYQVSEKQYIGSRRFAYAIKRIGDIDPTKLVHLGTLCGC